jgi:hypothetical protein
MWGSVNLGQSGGSTSVRTQMFVAIRYRKDQTSEGRSGFRIGCSRQIMVSSHFGVVTRARLRQTKLQYLICLYCHCDIAILGLEKIIRISVTLRGQ